MKTIAIANQKGGTGKTTTTYNLGVALAQQGYRVLMVDFDPQGNLSAYCGVPPQDDLSNTISNLMQMTTSNRVPMYDEFITHIDLQGGKMPRVDLIASNLGLANFAVTMQTLMCREAILKSCLGWYADRYDYCLIDCAPALGLLLVNALTAANEVIIPMQAQPFSVLGVAQLSEAISEVRSKINPQLRIGGILMTMTEHNSVSEGISLKVRSTYGSKFRIFSTEIPKNVDIQKSSAVGQAALEYDPKCSGAKAYTEFAKEVMKDGREKELSRCVENALDR